MTKGAGERGAAPGDGDVHWIRRMVRTAPGAVQIALRMLSGEMVQLRAMALTYISLFALVPGLVVAFSVVQAFTGVQRISERLHEFLFENLAVGARASIEPYLDRFIQNTHLASAGLVGAALLIWSSVSLFQTVDRAVNDIWGVTRRRSLAQQATIYWVGITLGPLLLAGSVMLGHSARSLLASQGLRVLGPAAAAALTCSFFALAYLLVPNTKVRPRNAVAAGLIAGVAWEVAKWAYATFVARSVRYSAIYGSVAAIPIFLLWLYLSWAILLFGARLAFVFQYASVLIHGPEARSRVGREVLAGRVLVEVVRAFEAGTPPPEPGDLAERLGAAGDEVTEALAALRTAGLVVAVGDGGVVPSRPPERLSMLDVRRALAGAEPPIGPGAGPVGEVVQTVEQEAEARLAAVTLRDLADRDRAGGESERSGAEAGRPVPPAPARQA